MKTTPLWAATLVALSACNPHSTNPEPVVSGTAPVANRAPARAGDAAPATCAADQFVACESGEACARKNGKLIRAKTCFDRAADACSTLGCAHGCNLYHGPPKEVHCAPNASTTSNNFERCGGFGNWACPEQMRCQLPAESGFDAFGKCVPAT